MDTLLEISTKRERPKISIDGKIYEINVVDDLSMIETTKMQDESQRAQELSKKKDLIPEERLELLDLIDKSVLQIVRGLKRRILKKLTPMHKTQIIQVFSEAAREIGKSRRRGVQSQSSKDSMGEIL